MTGKQRWYRRLYQWFANEGSNRALTLGLAFLVAGGGMLATCQRSSDPGPKVAIETQESRTNPPVEQKYEGSNGVNVVADEVTINRSDAKPDESRR